MRLISIISFLMSSMVTYRSNSDHNVVCRDIWFRIKRNLGPFWSLLGPIWQVLRSLKFLIFVNILVAAPILLIVHVINVGGDVMPFWFIVNMIMFDNVTSSAHFTALLKLEITDLEES